MGGAVGRHRHEEVLGGPRDLGVDEPHLQLGHDQVPQLGQPAGKG